MKKQVIWLAAVVLLLAGATAALFLLREDPDSAGDSPQGESAAPQELYVLGSASPSYVKEIVIENEGDRFTIQNGAQNLIQQQNNPELPNAIPGMDRETLNQSMLQSALSAAASLPAKRLVAQDGGDLSLYGLAQPRGTVDVVLEGKTLRLAIGDEAPGGEGTYAMAEGSVYLVDSNKLTNLLGDRYSFVNRAITPGNPESTKIGRVEMTGGALTDPLILEKAPDEEAVTHVGLSSYQITAPIQTGADAQTASALNSVFGLGASQVVGEAQFLGPDAAPYGLAQPDGPYLTVKVQALAQEEKEGEEPEAIPPFTLAFSQPDESGLVFAQCSLYPYIYRVAASQLPFLELSLFDFQEKAILQPNIDTLSQLEVATGDGAYAFQFSGEGKDLKVSLGGTELDTENFRKFYQTLMAARYDAPAEEGQEAPEEDPQLQITYRFRSGGAEQVIRYWPGGPRRMLVRLNDGPLYAAQSVYGDRVAADVSQVAAGEAVTPYR